MIGNPWELQIGQVIVERLEAADTGQPDMQAAICLREVHDVLQLADPAALPVIQHSAGDATARIESCAATEEEIQQLLRQQLTASATENRRQHDSRNLGFWIEQFKVAEQPAVGIRLVQVHRWRSRAYGEVLRVYPMGPLDGVNELARMPAEEASRKMLFFTAPEASAAVTRLALDLIQVRTADLEQRRRAAADLNEGMESEL